MSEVAKARARVTPDDVAALAWLRENREVLGVIVENFKAYQDAPPPDVEHLREPEPPSTEAAAPPAVADADPNAPRCSVCMSVLTDIDSPCPVCLAAGRTFDNPESLKAAQIAAAQPTATAPTFDAPRISNAVKPNVPIPAPAPPTRVYSANEVCRQCGRIADLHISHNPPGPLQHNFEALPQT